MLNARWEIPFLAGIGNALNEKARGVGDQWRHRRHAQLRNSSILANRLTIEGLEPRLLLSADAAPISGNIDVPGVTNQFVFQLTEPKKLYFDSLTDTPLTWSLTGPNGTPVSGRAIGSSDSYDIGGANILDLKVGEYTLTVDGAGDRTGAYTFRLLDIANAQNVALDQRVEGNNPGKETDLYKFDVNAGETVFFDAHTLSGQTVSLRLIGPDGELVRGPEGFGDSGAMSLSRGGSYTLAIEGYDTNAAAFDYAFTIAKVETARAALTIGDTVVGKITGPGDSAVYEFDLSTDTRLLFDTLLRSDNFTWTLAGPNGTIVNQRQFQSSDLANDSPVLQLGAGRYSLTIAAGGDRTGEFAFRVLSLASATPLPAGTAVELDDGGAQAARPRPTGAPIDYAGLPGVTNRAWNPVDAGSLQVVDDSAFDSAAVTLEAWVNVSDRYGYDGLLTRSTDQNFQNGYGLVKVDRAIRFYINNINSTYC